MSFRLIYIAFFVAFSFLLDQSVLENPHTELIIGLDHSVDKDQEKEATLHSFVAPETKDKLSDHNGWDDLWISINFIFRSTIDIDDHTVKVSYHTSEHLIPPNTDIGAICFRGPPCS